MAVSSTSSLLFLSSTSAQTLTPPKTLALTSFPFLSSASSSPSFLSLASSSFNARPVSVVLRRAGGVGTSLVRNVALSSEVEQEEEEEEGEGEGLRLSPDLKLFVGNLPFNVDSAELAGLFGQAGNVEMVEVIYDKLTGRSRGFGFVTMSTVEEVEAAAQQFNGYELDGRPLRVNSGPPPRRDEFQSRGFRNGGSNRNDEFQSRGFRNGGSNSNDEYQSRGFRNGGSSSNGASNRLYVGNLSWGVDDSALENLFSEQGKVVEAKVVYDRETGRSRGFGFVTYSSSEEVNSAISSLNGADLDGRSIRVTVAESRPRRQF